MIQSECELLTVQRLQELIREQARKAQVAGTALDSRLPLLYYLASRAS